MSPTKPGKSTKRQIVEPTRSKANRKTSKAAWAVNGGLVISTALTEIGQCTTVPGLHAAAQLVQGFFTTINNVRANKEDFQIIANDASELIIAIWRQQEKEEHPNEWISPEIEAMVGELKTALEKVHKIAEKQANRNLMAQVVFNMTDAGPIRQTREMIRTAVDRFQVLSHIKLNELLLEVATRQRELSQDIRHLNDSNAQVKENEEEEAEEVEEVPPLPSDQNTGPVQGKPPMSIHGFSFSNGAGYMYNSNVGNVVNSNVSNVGNNNSRNYYYG